MLRSLAVAALLASEVGRAQQDEYGTVVTKEWEIEGFVRHVRHGHALTVDGKVFKLEDYGTTTLEWELGGPWQDLFTVDGELVAKDWRDTWALESFEIRS